MSLRVIAASLVVLSVSATASEGQGLSGQPVALKRKLPPVVRLEGTRVNVTVEGTSNGRRAAEILRAKLVAHVFTDRRVQEDTRNPQTTIEVVLTDYSRRYEATDRCAGDKTVHVSGKIEASYRAIDMSDRHAIDAANIPFSYDEVFCDGRRITDAGLVKEFFGQFKKSQRDETPSTDELDALLVSGVALQIASRLVATDEEVAVYLPKGRFDAASNAGRNRRWGAMHEQLDRMSPLPRPQDNAYRLYGLGVAEEALAYEAGSTSEAHDWLVKAASHYRAARSQHPQDRQFAEAEHRIAHAVSQYTALIANAERERNPGATARGETEAEEASLNNADIEKLAQARFSENHLLGAIAEAPDVNFDLSIDAQIRLKTAGVSEKVIAAMKTRMRGRAR